MENGVRIKINRNEIKTVSVSSEEFGNFTIRQLKKRALTLFPGVNDPCRLRLIFGQNELKDDQTFQSCNIEHLAILFIVLRMPEGRGSPDPGGTEAQGKDVQTAAASSSAQSDPDQQFLQSLLPALKRMDLRRREQTKLRIQQLVFDAEFNDPSDDRSRRRNSMDKIPPYM